MEKEIEYYFSQREEGVRRYSVAGRVIEEKGKKFLQVAYVVCSDEDRFKKSTARRKLNIKLEAEYSEKKGILVPIPPMADWKQFFAHHAARTAPATVLDKKTSWLMFHQVTKQLKKDGAKTLPSKPGEIIMIREEAPQMPENLMALQQMMARSNPSLGLKGTSLIGEA